MVLGFQQQSPSSSEFISIRPAPGGAGKAAPASSLYLFIYLSTFFLPPPTLTDDDAPQLTTS